MYAAFTFKNKPENIYKNLSSKFLKVVHTVM